MSDRVEELGWTFRQNTENIIWNDNKFDRVELHSEAVIELVHNRLVDNGASITRPDCISAYGFVVCSALFLPNATSGPAITCPIENRGTAWQPCFFAQSSLEACRRDLNDFRCQIS